jgi:hypothetical protein
MGAAHRIGEKDGVSPKSSGTNRISHGGKNAVFQWFNTQYSAFLKLLIQKGLLVICWCV